MGAKLSQKGAMDPDRFQMRDIKRRLDTMERRNERRVKSREKVLKRLSDLERTLEALAVYVGLRDPPPPPGGAVPN